MSLAKTPRAVFCFPTSDSLSDLFFFRCMKKGHSKSLYFVLMISMFFSGRQGWEFCGGWLLILSGVLTLNRCKRVFWYSLLVHLFLVWKTVLLENLLCWICQEVENIFCFIHYQNSRSSVAVHEYFVPVLVLALYVQLICGQCYSCTWKWHFQNNNLAPVYNITLFVLGQFHFVFQLPPCLHAKQILYQDLFPLVCCLYGLECIQN